MPYIRKQSRKRYDRQIAELTRLLLKDDAPAGEINYVFSRVLKGLFEARRSYTEANKLVGVLECVKLEIYRRSIVPYEDEKILENGDI